MTPVPLWAFLDLPATVLFWVIRGAIGVGGAVLGYFIAGPIVHLLYRLAFHKPVPRWVMPWARLGFAALIGFLFFWYLPLGGSGGLGWGPGAGGGPGLGPGDGSGQTDGGHTDGKKIDDNGKTPGKKNSSDPLKIGPSLEIELLGGERYKGDERYYLIERKEPAKTIGEVEEFFETNFKSTKKPPLLRIMLMPEGSVSSKHGAVGRLKILAEKYRFEVVVKVDDEKK